MTAKHDGGPAFPRPASEDTSSGTLSDGNDLIQPQDGMSLRDYFAAQALAGILASPQLVVTKPAPELAVNCYAIADAMLAERAK